MMLRGISRIGSITLTLGLLFSTEISALENISIPKNKTATHALDQNYQISGAYGMQNYFFVVNDNDPIVYQLGFETTSTGLKKTKLIPYRKLEDLYGYYSYARSIPGNKKFDLEGVTSCTNNNGMAFYLVNEKTGDILKADSKNLTKLDINYEDFPDFRYDVGNDGFMGVTADCKNQKLFVAKQKNPNIVFEVSLTEKRVTRSFNMSTGSDSEDDISDLFFKDNNLYVLQKNITSIAIVNPAKVTDFVSCRYDYSSMSSLTMIEEKGIAEGLVVQNNSIYLFLDQRKGGKSGNDKSRDVIVELKI